MLAEREGRFPDAPEEMRHWRVSTTAAMAASASRLRAKPGSSVPETRARQTASTIGAPA